jgi:hypothetical protein
MASIKDLVVLLGSDVTTGQHSDVSSTAVNGIENLSIDDPGYDQDPNPVTPIDVIVARAAAVDMAGAVIQAPVVAASEEGDDAPEEL